MQVHMMSLYSATVLLAICVLGTSIAPAFGDHCITSPAVVGGSGSMTFHFRHGLNMSSATFIAYIKRTGDMANAIRCDLRVGSGITCEIINYAFKPTTIVNHSLTLTAADVTPELGGYYTLRTFVGGDEEPPVKCYFEVQNKTTGFPNKASLDILVIVVPVVVVLVAVLIGVVIVLKRKNKLPCLSPKKRNTTDAPQVLEENRRSDEQAPFLEMLEDVSGKLWYCAGDRLDDEQDLLSFQKNKVEGSFGIGKCPQDPEFYKLNVYHGHELNCFRLRPSEHGVNFVDAGTCFRTLFALVAHYRIHDIIDKDTNTSYGKLVKPFEKAPEGPWYAGKIKRKEQNSILGANGHGAFLIRESITKKNAYTLAMNIEKKVEKRRIIVEDDGYTLVDADELKYFQTLSALVDFYKENDLYVLGKHLGRLSKPAQGITGAAAAGTQEEFGTESK